MINKSIFLSFILMFTSVVVVQTDAQLRDPEYLVEQYNQLVAKHNALIEKTRNLIKNQAQQQNNVETVDPQAQQKLPGCSCRGQGMNEMSMKI